MIPHSSQPSFFSTTGSVSPGVFDCFLLRKNGSLERMAKCPLDFWKNHLIPKVSQYGPLEASPRTKKMHMLPLDKSPLCLLASRTRFSSKVDGCEGKAKKQFRRRCILEGRGRSGAQRVAALMLDENGLGLGEKKTSVEKAPGLPQGPSKGRLPWFSSWLPQTKTRFLGVFRGFPQKNNPNKGYPQQKDTPA